MNGNKHNVVSIFGALAGMIGFTAKVFSDNKGTKDYSIVPRSMLHPLEDTDDEGPPYGVVKDPDKYMNPYD